MDKPIPQSDVTGTVNLADPGDVATVVCTLFTARFGPRYAGVLRRAFGDIEDAFWGRYPGLLPCDTPYHDLRHSLGTALLMMRMLDGYMLTPPAGAPLMPEDFAAVAVLLALFHDIGFLRTEAEAHLNGASLILEHEQRSVDFMHHYLATGVLAAHAERADLIHATNFSRHIAQTLAGLPPLAFVVGQMLGSADLLSQIAGRYYLERCRSFLYHEFVVAGVDKKRLPDGEVVVLYASPEDLLRKTPGFYEHLVKPRLEVDFESVHTCVAAHFGGSDLYAQAVANNLDTLRDMIARNDFSGLRRRPIALIPPPA